MLDSSEAGASFSGPGAPARASSTRSHLAHRVVTGWTHFIDTVFAEPPSSPTAVDARAASENSLPGHEDAAVYFSIQDGVVQNDADVYEFPLDRLQRDIPLPPLVPHSALTSSNLWFGKNARTRAAKEAAASSDQSSSSSSSSSSSAEDCDSIHTHLHNDPHDNLYVVVRGFKRLRIFAPSEALRLRTVAPPMQIEPDGRVRWAAANAQFKGYRFSKFPAGPRNADAASQAEHPTAKDAVYTHVDLVAGDLFYLPRGWWHDVSSDCSGDDRITLAINHWFEPSAMLKSWAP